MANEGQSKGIAASVLPYTTVLLIVVALYVGWTFYSRWHDAKAAEESAAAQKAERNKQVVEKVFGSGSLKLLNFSVSRARLQRGESAQLCYGVVNAVSVVLEPHLEDSKPSANHCLEVSPKANTTYTLTAKDQAGHTETHSLSVTVK